MQLKPLVLIGVGIIVTGGREVPDYMRKFHYICLLASVLLLLAACGKNAQERWQEQYDLGIRYLEEENYEEAVVAFTTAIEIDSKNVDSYIGLADSYIGLENISAAIDILERGYVAIKEERLLQKKEELQKKIEEEERKSYIRKYEEGLYENLMGWLCLHGEYFNNVEEIEDVSSFFHIFYHFEKDYEEMNEKWYTFEEQTHKIPGNEVRRILMKYLDFQSLELSEKMPAYAGPQTSGYDRVSDTYYCEVLGGFGSEIEDITEIKFETLDVGVVKATAYYNLLNGEEYQETVVVKEENDQVLKLVFFQGEGLQNTNILDEEKNRELKEKLDSLEQMQMWELDDFLIDVQSIDVIGRVEKRFFDASEYPTGYDHDYYMLVLDEPAVIQFKSYEDGIFEQICDEVQVSFKNKDEYYVGKKVACRIKGVDTMMGALSQYVVVIAVAELE